MKNNDRAFHISILKTTLIILALASGVLFVSFASQNYVKKMSVDEKSPKSPVEMMPEGKGVFSLESLGQRTVFIPNEDIEVLLVADSKGAQIGMFDSILDQVGQDIALRKVTSLIPGFDVHIVNEKKGWINGALIDHEAQNGVPFGNEPIAQLIFEATKEGSHNLTFDFTPRETRDSNMMQMSPPIDVLAHVDGLKIYVGSQLNLKPFVQNTISQSPLSVTLTKATVPEKDCFDCLSQAEIEVKQGERIEKVTLALGGFEGKPVDYQDLFGYRFETSSIQKDTMVLYVARIDTAHEK